MAITKNFGNMAGKKSFFSINDTTAMNGEPFHPLHLPPPTPLLLKPESAHSEKELQEIRNRRRAKNWPCGHCVFLLGFCHLFCGIFLLGFDIATNHITKTPFAVTASLGIIICAIFSFISSRRIDKASQILLFSFSFLSLTICGILFYQNAYVVNNLCETWENCQIMNSYIFSGLLAISLIEGTICLITTFVCYRSLHQAYLVPNPDSPFKTIIAGDYLALKKEPVQIMPKHYDDIISSLLA